MIAYNLIMITEDLYTEVLVKPVIEGNNELHIVSGYSSATFLRRHLKDVLIINPGLKINLIIGMKNNKNDHSAYLNLINTNPRSFEGHYFSGNGVVHSKVYSWSKDNTPSKGFSGSANYSQSGFFGLQQQNQMVQDSPQDIKDYYHSLLDVSIPIKDYEAEVDEFFDHRQFMGSLLPGSIEWEEPNKSVRISLLSKDGNLPPRSGLNWGQRPEQNRDPNQAYLSIRSDARNEGFLPEKKFSFTLLTDDKSILDCTVQQDGRKAISTTNDNSELGLYFRKRLGVSSGEIVLKEHLMKYGRTDFLLKKLDEETFFLDFSA